MWLIGNGRGHRQPGRLLFPKFIFDLSHLYSHPFCPPVWASAIEVLATNNKKILFNNPRKRKVIHYTGLRNKLKNTEPLNFSKQRNLNKCLTGEQMSIPCQNPRGLESTFFLVPSAELSPWACPLQWWRRAPAPGGNSCRLAFFNSFHDQRQLNTNIQTFLLVGLLGRSNKIIFFLILQCKRQPPFLSF